jgi:hypothetical protein
VDVLVRVLGPGSSPVFPPLVVLLTVLVASIVLWLVARRRPWPFWVLVLVALAIYLALRVVVSFLVVVTVFALST